MLYLHDRETISFRRKVRNFYFLWIFYFLFLFQRHSRPRALTKVPQINLRIPKSRGGIWEFTEPGWLYHRNRMAALFICRSTTHFFFFSRARSDVLVSHLHRDWMAAVYISVWGRESLIFVHWICENRAPDWVKRAIQRQRKACAIFHFWRYKSIIFLD